MSHKGSISQPHSWGITFAYRPLPGAFRGLVTNAAWLGMGCRAGVSRPAPLLSEKFALCFDHGIWFGFFLGFLFAAPYKHQALILSFQEGAPESRWDRLCGKKGLRLLLCLPQSKRL